MHYKGSIIDFPKRIILNNLEGLPEIIDIAILGGLDSATVRILNFSIECDFSANLSMIFDFETYKFETLDFYFEGIQFLALALLNNIVDKRLIKKKGP